MKSHKRRKARENPIFRLTIFALRWLQPHGFHHHLQTDYCQRDEIYNKSHANHLSQQLWYDVRGALKRR